MGKANVSVDGGTAVSVNLNAATTSWQQKVFSTGTLAAGLHTLTITPDPANTATQYLNLDGLEVVGTLASATRFEETDTHLTFAGSWASAASTAYSGGTFKYANTSGASVTIKFFGVKLTLIGTKAYSYGKMKVSVDGSSPTTVDLYNPTTVLYKQTLFSSGLVPLGEHTVTLEWTGEKNPASSNTYVSLDAVDVTGTVR